MPRCCTKWKSSPMISGFALWMACNVILDLSGKNKSTFPSPFYVWALSSAYVLPWVILRGNGRGLLGSLVQSPPMSRSTDNCSMARRLWLAARLLSRWTLNAFGSGRQEWADGFIYQCFLTPSLSFFVFTFTEVIKAKRVTQSSVENGSLLNTTTGLFTDRTTFSRRGLVQ